MPNNLLIIEDERLLGQELERHYKRKGFDVTRAVDLSAARVSILEERLEPPVVLADMSLPDGNSLDLLAELREQPAIPWSEWVFLTGYGGVPESVRALRLGAYDFLEKPCDQARLDLVINGAARAARAQRRLMDQQTSRQAEYKPERYIGRSQAAQEVREIVQMLAQAPFSALLIDGETGTGKGLAARILHHNSDRSDGPLVELNCAALPRELLESELFGHEAGAFTGAKGRHRGLLEQAHNGALFLDEIGEMALELQSKLLRAIDEQHIRRVGSEREIKIDVRIITATNRNLEQEIEAGRFRADLFHRLSVFRLHLPPLRERIEDLDDLLPNLVHEYNARAGKHVKTIPDDVWEQMRQHAWPGNVRELRNVVERCVLLAQTDVFPARWLQLVPASAATPGEPETRGDRLCLPLDGSMALDEMDRYIIKTTLERNAFNVTATARALGTTRETLRYRIQKYQLDEAVKQGRD